MEVGDKKGGRVMVMSSVKVYRPEGWVNPHGNDLANYYSQVRFHAYEAGADAMLEVVNDKLIPLGIEFKEDGMYHRTGLDNQFTNYNWARIVQSWAHMYGKSRVVFIPEAE
jgi:hypothetical protein